MKVKVLKNFIDSKARFWPNWRVPGVTYDELDEKRAADLEKAGYIRILEPKLETSTPPEMETKKKKPGRPRKKATK